MKPKRKGSQDAAARRNALGLEPGVFRLHTPEAIAQSLKRAAEANRRHRARPFHSALLLLSFHINRAGRSLPEPRRQILEAAKGALRDAFARTPPRPALMRSAFSEAGRKTARQAASSPGTDKT